MSKHDCFALLDDASSGASVGEAHSRLYTGYHSLLRCDDPAQLDAFWQTVEQAQADGLHALVLADYEWGVRLQGLPTRHAPAGSLRILLFHACQHLSTSAVEQWLASAEGSAASGVVGLAEQQESVAAPAFAEAIGRIHAAIRAGESYQVNYSYRRHARLAGSAIALYRRLRARQPVAYGALIALPEGETPSHVLSFSPELFLRHERGTLTARPMKGTAPRHADSTNDLLAREQLATPKSRAENLMIVDLLRNDLGRVATVGSVKVPALFEVEGHATVWQMTSTVTAQRAPGKRFPDLLRALFPCGSVTGAPKHRTLQLIDALETSSRGLYCGALGWIDRPEAGEACADFCLSVPIRTLTLGEATEGWRVVELGLGAGIVADSDATQEHAECRLKASFFTGIDQDFALIETLFAEQGVIRHRERHMARLLASAATLGFRHDATALAQALDTELSTLPATAHRLRLLLYPDGRCTLTAAPLEPNPVEPVSVLLADRPINPDDWPLAHKTTVRAPYDQALAQAMAAGAFDMLFFNVRGELTEGARSNVFIRLDGHWLTPALSCGVLPGVMRAVLLADPAFAVREVIITRADLQRADELLVCNALRGVLRAHISR